MNREMVWVRITLAKWLRKRKNSEEAQRLFGDIAMSAVAHFDEPWTEEKCRIVERAAMLVKVGLAAETKGVLTKSELR